MMLKKNVLRNDVFLIVAILIIALCAYLFMLWGRDEGNRVQVVIDGNEYLNVPLNVDGKWDIKNVYGYNEIVIKDGKVAVLDADCKDKICVHEGWKDKDKQTIVCLPHKLVVNVISSNEKLDGISQ